MRERSAKVPSMGRGTHALCSKGWGNKPCSWDTSCAYAESLQTCFSVYADHSFRQTCFCWKKIFQSAIIIPLWIVTGQVLLACLGNLALSPGIAQICYQELGCTVANGNSVSTTVWWIRFSSNWKLSCAQTWQDTDHGRQFLKDPLKNLSASAEKLDWHPRGQNVV